MNKPPVQPPTPITINHNINIRVIKPIKPVKPPAQPKLNFRTIGAAAVSCALIASEALPFFDDIKADGILHGLVKYFESSK